MSLRRVSRREVLKLASVASLGTVGRGTAASPDRIRANVGYETDRGRQTVREMADEIIYDFSFDAHTVRIPKATFTSLADHSDIRYVEPDSTVRGVSQRLSWGIDRVDAEIAHTNGDTGNGVDIAILDSGIDSNHPDLQPNLGEGTAMVSCRGDCSTEWDDDHGHGTHGAGIANAVNNTEGVVGVSTDATLHAVKVLDDTNGGLNSWLGRGIDYVANKGWDVANISITSPTSFFLRDAVKHATDEGVLLVAASGNDGPCTDCVGYPAALEECIAVSATNTRDSLAWFSSTGSQIELAAPGVGIYSTYYGESYETMSGTSMASPHVAGAGGLLMANGYTNTEARQRLTETAEDIGLPSDEQGAGLLDVAAALGYDSDDDLGAASSIASPGTI